MKVSKAYIANIAFVLGVLCFIAPFLVSSRFFEFFLLILTYCLLLASAFLSVDLSSFRKWALVKGVVAFICCFLTTPYLKFLATIFYIHSIILLNFVVVILHIITLAVIVLPLIGLVRNIRAKRTVMTEALSGPDTNVQILKRKKLQTAITSIVLILLVVFLAVKITPLIMASPVISVNYFNEYKRVTKPEGYDPNQNAATYYKKAIESLVSQSEFTQELWWKIWPEDMSETEQKALNDWLAANDKTLDYLKKAAQKPYYWLEPYSKDNSLANVNDFCHIPYFNALVECLDFDARLKAYQGQIEPALENVINVQKLASHLHNSKVLISQLRALAIHRRICSTANIILGKKYISSQILTNFQNQLEQQSLQAPKGFIYDAEKLVAYDTIQRVFADDGSGNGRLIPGRYLDVYGLPELRLRYYVGAVWVSLTSPGKRQTTELTKKLYELLDDLAQKTPFQLHQQDTSHELQVYELTRGNYYVRRTSNYLGGLCVRWQEVNTNIKALITTVALFRYKADKGRFPENLDHLVSSGYLNKLPMDPYSSGSLVYKLLDDGFTLYSLGADFDDDGGIQSWWGRRKEGGDRVFWPVKRTEVKR